jgi:flagellar protein FliO/FliZ
VSGTGYISYLLALLLVLGLILGLAWLVRRFGLAGPLAVPPGRRRRLQLVEVLTLDARRRLVLVRRDEAEHLLLLGANEAIVVERDLGAAARFELPDDSYTPSSDPA